MDVNYVQKKNRKNVFIVGHGRRKREGNVPPEIYFSIFFLDTFENCAFYNIC